MKKIYLKVIYFELYKYYKNYCIEIFSRNILEKALIKKMRPTKDIKDVLRDAREMNSAKQKMDSKRLVSQKSDDLPPVNISRGADMVRK